MSWDTQSPSETAVKSEFEVMLNDTRVIVRNHDELRAAILRYATEKKYSSFLVVSDGREITPEDLDGLDLDGLELKIAGYFKAN